jgi:hypothetical protein
VVTLKIRDEDWVFQESVLVLNAGIDNVLSSVFWGCGGKDRRAAWVESC